MDAKPAFRQQQITEHETWALEAVHDIEHLGDELEAIGNVQRSRDRSGIIPKRCAEHLPEVALLGLGGNTRGRAGSLTVDDHHRGFDHGGHAESLAHQGEATARCSAHRADARVSRADRHIDHADLVLHLPDHDAGFARVCRHPVQDPGRRAHGIGTIEFHTCCRTSHGHRNIATQDRVPVIRLRKGIRESREVRSGIIVTGARNADVFGHNGLAFSLKLLSKDVL
jgi:hypothetical protein